MNIVKSKDRNFIHYYRILSLKIKWISSTYSHDALEYFKLRSSENSISQQNSSFILLVNNKPVACFLGVKILKNNKVDLYAYEQPCITIIDKNNITKKQSKFFILEVKKIINSINGVFYYKDFIYNGELSILSQYLLTQGERPIVNFSSFIDLSNSVSEIKRDVRKSYKSLINKGNNELNPEVFDSQNITWDKLNEFRLLHIYESGRETMSIECWKGRMKMIQSGAAFLILGRINKSLVTAGFFTINNSHCYYGSSASIRSLFDKPLLHSIIWRAIVYAKSKKCLYFEVGSKMYPYNSGEATNKELSISKFKSGFGDFVKVFVEFSFVK